MTSDSPTGTLNADAETRIAHALLCAVVDNLKSNRLVVPVFGLAICGIFQQWVGYSAIAIWYVQMLLSLIPQTLVLWRFPSGPLAPDRLRRWTAAIAVSNLFFVANWASLGWYFWAPGKAANHVMIELILAATLAAHATVTGQCRTIARPALLLYLIVLILAPLQAFLTPQFSDAYTRALTMAAIGPVYVVFISLLTRRNIKRAIAAVLLVEERNHLLTELMQAKQESDRGRERAEAASVAKSQFLANMSHELRTPLNAILGFSEMIASRMFAGDPERNFEYAQLIHSSGGHLLALINDILDLAKIEAGRWKLEEGEQDLHRIAGDALQLVTWRTKDSNAVLQNTIDPNLSLIYADERAVKQILLNLLSNAVKFTPKGGRVTAFARMDADGGLAFGVSDTGIGIAAEDQKRVFDSFGQGKHDIAITDKGTGLGLAIVKGLSESHDGHVTLWSEVGKGTRVTVHLPASRVRPRTIAARVIAQDELAHFVA
jgi:two-component system cell cycle sensor histidine kinase PleC